jgi:Tfp pilus assembly ATPase PilU
MTGRTLTPEDLMSLEQYARRRAEFRPMVLTHKRDRTIQQAIEQNELNRLTEIIEMCNHQGMHSFDQYLTELIESKTNSLRTIRSFPTDRTGRRRC